MSAPSPARYTKPPLMAALEVEYWIDLPLEMIESQIARGSEEDKVFFTILRCSLCHTQSSPYAVRPRLKKGGFAGWVKALHARIDKGGAIPARALEDEITDTDDAGEPLKLTQKDVCDITRMTKNNVSRGVGSVRENRRLLPDAEAFYIDPKPPAPPLPPQKDPGVLSTENWHVAGLVLSTENLPPDSEERTQAQKWAADLSTRWKTALSDLKTQFRKEARKGSLENRILIRQKAKVKSRHAEPACPPEPEFATAPEPEAQAPPKLAGLRALFPNEHLDAEALKGLNAYFVAELGAAYVPEGYIEFVRHRQSKGKTGKSKIGTGLVFDRKGLPRDFIAWVQAHASSRAAPIPRDTSPPRWEGEGKWEADKYHWAELTPFFRGSYRARHPDECPPKDPQFPEEEF